MQASMFHNADETLQPDDLALAPRQNASTVTRSTFLASRNALPERQIADKTPKAIVQDVPLRKYERVETDKSVTKSFTGAYMDAGLALGRSFRVGWGPDGQLVHLGKICGVAAKDVLPSSPSVVHVTQVPLLSNPEDIERSRVNKLLDFQIKNTDVEMDEDGIPVATPNADLRFHQIADLFGPDDHSHESSVWRLGSALFDEINLRLAEDASFDIKQQVSALRRRAALAKWLQLAVAPSVEFDLRELNGSTAANRAFLMLTGNQVSRATEAAMEADEVHLATLISQIGGDAEFRSDIESQLVKWKEQKVDAHVDVWIRKVYALLAGIVDTVEGSKSRDPAERCGDVAVAQGLDWKRAYGLHLWFGGQFNSPIVDSVNSYEGTCDNSAFATAAPHPWYIERPSSIDSAALTWTVAGESAPKDALFEVIKLAIDDTIPLDNVLYPRAFGPSPVDYRISWHVYILLAQVLRKRDVSDRSIMVEGEDDEAYATYSHKADSITSNYASQLENLGLWWYSVFVLLHLQESDGRAIAIKSLLTRHVADLDPEKEEFLVNQLCVPQEWIEEAKAILFQYSYQSYQAFECFVAAGQVKPAYDMAMRDLAPEAAIRNDFALLAELFTDKGFDGLDDWTFRGKLYLQYADCMSKLSDLLFDVAVGAEDPIQAREVERLSRAVPQLLGLLPEMFPDKTNIRQQICLGNMISSLMQFMTPLKQRGMAIRPQLQSAMVEESVRLELIQTMAYDRSRQSLAGLTSRPLGLRPATEQGVRRPPPPPPVDLPQSFIEAAAEPRKSTRASVQAIKSPVERLPEAATNTSDSANRPIKQARVPTLPPEIDPQILTDQGVPRPPPPSVDLPRSLNKATARPRKPKNSVQYEESFAEAVKSSAKGLVNTTTNTPNSVNKLINQVGVQLLSPKLHSQIFPDVSLPAQSEYNIETSQRHLKSHGLDTNLASRLTETSFDLPALQGKSIDEHFYRIGAHMAEPWLNIAKEFADWYGEFPAKPEYFDQSPGWTKYYPDGSFEHVEDLGSESAICFDVEALPAYSPFAVMACAVSSTACFLTLDQEWETYIKSAESKYHELEDGVRTRLASLAERALAMYQNDTEGNKPWETDEWLNQLDWTPKKMGKSRGGNAPPAPMFETQPKWYTYMQKKKVLGSTAANRIIPFLLGMTWHDTTGNYYLFYSSKHGWLKGKPIGERQYEPAVTIDDDDELTPFRDVLWFVRLAGKTPVRSILTRRGVKWIEDGTIECQHEELALRFCAGTAPDSDWEALRAIADEVVARGQPTYHSNIATSQLDWKPIRVGETVRDTPADVYWPRWYWELTSPKPGREPGTLDLTVRSRVSPLLMRLSWLGHPLFHSRQHGWTYRVPADKLDTVGTTSRALIFHDDADIKLKEMSKGDNFRFYKLPHKDGEQANVGSPLSKTFLKYSQNGTLTGPGDEVKSALDMNAQCSYWISARDRIQSQVVLWDGQAKTSMGMPNIPKFRGRFGPHKYGMVLPQVITMGTVTRRAIEKTWLTASNAKANRVGSELKALVRAPEGYSLVGADVDSEELWIASVMGDAQFGIHGATAIGWMTLEGTKAAGTDLHSKTANILGISRNDAKVFNYSRIYGAGIKHAVLLLLQHNASMKEDAAYKLAKDLYASTKGKSASARGPFGKKFWHGGSESYLFNKLEAIALSDEPRTPALDCGITSALSKKYLPTTTGTGDDYMTSRINWVVQSSGVDYLHLLIVAVDYLIQAYNIEARYLISIHDEVRYLAKEEDKYRLALALQIANLWTRCMFAYKLGFDNLPQGVAFFSAVDVDNYLRKEVYMTCVTPSQPTSLPPGESLTIEQILEKTSGGLLTLDLELNSSVELELTEPSEPYIPPDVSAHREKSVEFLRAQMVTEREEMRDLALRARARAHDLAAELEYGRAPRAARPSRSLQ
ncbi:DNA-directed DNA polymerase gamma mip1 [Ceratobasidium sp. 392]|nr:DNA-directed DNA polymerase gamma mip1 [Ceratobasidium sp. 392]